MYLLRYTYASVAFPENVLKLGSVCVHACACVCCIVCVGGGGGDQVLVRAISQCLLVVTQCSCLHSDNWLKLT